MNEAGPVGGPAAHTARLAGPTVGPHTPGESGIWVLIIGEMTLFAVLFVTFLVQRADAPDLFRSSQEHLVAAYGAINVVLLLTGSLCVVLGVRAVRAAAAERAVRLFAAASATGVGFVAIKCLEYGGKLSHGLKPATNEFWTLYYVATGLHLFHLLVGLAVLGFLIARVRRAPVDRGALRYVEGGACYWHMVDLLWIVLFPLLYLVR